jgi:hypothetical protein
MSQTAADELQRRLMSFAVKIIELVGRLPASSERQSGLLKPKPPESINNHSPITNNHSLLGTSYFLPGVSALRYSLW